MFVTMTSYHQLMPSFLDFLFSFGAQHHAKDFFFTGFHHDTRLSDTEKGDTIPALGRSGRIMQLCYSLRSVEASSEQEKWPWSIRGIATHHAFDLETGRTSWLMVKGEGGTSMKERIITETSSQNGNVLNSFGSLSQAFSSAMSTHLLLCSWSVENWRWYINYMEEEVQAITRKTLSVTVAKPQTEARPQKVFTRTITGALVPPKKTLKPESLSIKGQPGMPFAQMAPAPLTQGPFGPPEFPPTSMVSKPVNFSAFQYENEFSFEDLPRIEYIEEHANEALLVNTLNSQILSALAQHYSSVLDSTHCPYDIKTECTTPFRQFVSRISDNTAEIQTQKARIETLLRLLADRKALVFNYQCVGIMES